MKSLTVQQLQCFDAVIAEGSYQAAAIRLGRTHPTIFTAIKNLEAQLGVALFDRTGYRASPTEAGRALHTRVRSVLAELNVLCDRAARLAAGEETSLTVIVGDLCPLPPTLGLLRRFFEGSPVTQLDLRFEALGGPAERLSDGSADLILHYIDKTDPNLEFIDLLEVRLIPVVADGFLRFPITRSITPDQIAHLRPVRDRRQCQAGPLPELSSGGRRAPLDSQRSVDEEGAHRARYGLGPHAVVHGRGRAGRWQAEVDCWATLPRPNGRACRSAAAGSSKGSSCRTPMAIHCGRTADPARAGARPGRTTPWALAQTRGSDRRKIKSLRHPAVRRRCLQLGRQTVDLAASRFAQTAPH